MSRQKDMARKLPIAKNIDTWQTSERLKDVYLPELQPHCTPSLKLIGKQRVKRQ